MRTPEQTTPDTLPAYDTPTTIDTRSARKLGRVALCAGLAVIALVSGTGETNATESASISATPVELSIPSDLPDITKTHRSLFDGKGAPLSSEPSGYILGRLFNLDEFMQTLPSYSRTNAFGVAVRKEEHKPSQCGWLETKVLSDDKVYDHPDDPCIKYWGTMKNRYSFGKDFNCPERACVDGAPETELTDECNHKAYYNYAPAKRTFNNLTYPDDGSGLYDYAGYESGPVRYRYRSRYSSEDGVVISVRSDRFGWIYLKGGCVNGTPQGGTRKTSATVPGPNPNRSK